ncbi:TQO small subunit DoxD [Streptacidiphilus fuscans]|uniref:DoxX family membrane protein n=1 Tax=Streptacidiphilus fuscans TaxID=2789292 RepID=A0A931BDJ8_9ACTN|nr:TQO small subunit DoxD [Streptacidiphilus fuscans]MBF9072248.1 DoxX family membrane protein [Streptacidiphilus fuscans]
MDTRTRTRPRPRAASDGGADAGEATLNTVKVPSDPTRLNITTASFRVRFTPPSGSLIDPGLVGAMTRDSALVGAGTFAGPASAGAAAGVAAGGALGVPGSLAGSVAVPGLTGAVRTMPRRRGRVVPITYTGQLDLAVPPQGVPGQAGAPASVGGRGRGVALGDMESTQQMTQIDFDELDNYEDFAGFSGFADLDGVQVFEPPARRPPLPDTPASSSAQHHAWHPGKRVDLGLVLLPLRVFLGCISVYAGFSKLCDPVYFDGGARGSMTHWLQALHPWSIAQPLLTLAMDHPVGAGLAVAFVQINVGVLAILGLWQRASAAVAMVLSVALLATASWRAVPVYDTPEIIYLAAWSPLLLAGAPMFSLDGWLHLEAWRRLGEHAQVRQLRRRVLRRGVVLATVVIGATFLLGSVLGAAVRASHVSQTTSVPSETPVPSPSASTPGGDWPSGAVPVPVQSVPTSGKSGHSGPGSTSAKPSPSSSHKHHSGSTGTSSSTSSSSSTGSTRTGAGTGAGSGSGSSGTSGSSRTHKPGSGQQSPGNPNGVIGGLLG